MSMLTVLPMIYVTKAIALMLAESQPVEAMLDVKTKSTPLPAYVYQTTSEIPELHVIHVSWRYMFFIRLEQSLKMTIAFAWYFHFYPISAELPTSPQLSVGCEYDEDCPLYNACENRQCIDPCVVRDPCGRNAYCKVVNHEPVCTCPDGYIGSPETDCRPRK